MKKGIYLLGIRSLAVAVYGFTGKSTSASLLFFQYGIAKGYAYPGVGKSG